jgi:GT2 family glycosyltransferase
MPPDITISIINTNNREVVLQCLASVYETAEDLDLEVIVVNNACTDGSTEAIRARFPQVKIIENSQMLGFSTNNNLAFAQATGRYLMLLNDDTVTLPGALVSMVQYMDAHPEAAAIGSRLLNPDRSPQISAGPFPHPILEAFLPLTLRWLVPNESPNETVEVDWVCGASMLVRNEVVRKVGLLDEAFNPIYSEETDWCFRIKEQGGRIFLLPQAEIIHIGGQTMNRNPVRRVELLRKHQALYFLKHHGIGTKYVFLGCLWLTSLLKLISWFILFPIKRDRARAEISVHWHMVLHAIGFLK